jgi:hypothetical protein
MLVDRMGENVIRINNDRPQDHEILIDRQGFLIRDKHGRTIDQDTLVTAIIRKPAPFAVETEDESVHCFRETSAAHSGLLHLIEYLWPEKLPISPSRIRDVSKFVQLHAAKSIFTIAPWAFTTHPERSKLNEDIVVKTLSGSPFSPGKGDKSATFIYVEPAKLGELAESYPWFLQERVEARFDLTILYIDGVMFAQRLDRMKFEGLDWRKHIGTSTDNLWERYELSADFQAKISRYMQSISLRFGRLDFLANDQSMNDALFLEVNPNGQWAWMDLKMDNGIFDAMVSFLCKPVRK